MLYEVTEIMKNNPIDDIYFAGVVHTEEDGTYEFIANKRLLYLEFGERLIEIEAIDCYDKLRISIVDSFQHECEIDDMAPSITKVGSIVFTNPLAANYVQSIICFNLENRDNAFLSDVLHIRLNNGQDLFIDPQFIGINIGGLEQKQFWKENYEERVLPRVGKFPDETMITIDYTDESSQSNGS